MNPREFDQVISKFGMATRNGRDIHAWLEHDGRVVIRTKRSMGNKTPIKKFVRNQLKLTEEQLAAAIRCTFGREDYLGVLREKGLL